MFFVVEAPRSLHGAFEVHFSLVAHPVDVGGSVCPGDAGDAAAGLHVPAPDIDHAAGLTLTPWGEKK